MRSRVMSFWALLLFISGAAYAQRVPVYVNRSDWAADKLPYLDGTGSADVTSTDFSTFGRSLVGAADAGAAGALLGLSPAQVVTVAKSGGQHTTVTAAAASITDSSTSKRYVIVVYPGEYSSENVVLPGYTSLIGAGDHVATTITSSSGITVTAPAAATAGNIANISIESTGDGGTVFKQTTGFCIHHNVWFSWVNSDNGASGTLLDIDGGVFSLYGGKLRYNGGGDSVGVVTHIPVAVTGSSNCTFQDVHSDCDTEDYDDNMYTYNFDSSYTGEFCIEGGEQRIDALDAAYVGAVNFVRVLGLPTKACVRSLDIEVSSAGNGTGTLLYLDSPAGGAEVQIFGVNASLTGFTTNYAGDIAAGDTAVTGSSNLIAAQGSTGAGIFTRNALVLNGDLYVTTDMHAAYIEFDDVENTYIGIDKTYPTYFAFSNDETNFWLGNASDKNIWMNYEKDADIIVGSGTGGDTDIQIHEGTANKTTLGQTGIDFDITVGVANGGINLTPNGTGTVNVVDSGVVVDQSGTGVNSPTLTLSGDNAGNAVSGVLQLIYGADPYLRISVDQDGSGTGTAVVLDIHDQAIVFGTDNTTDIGTSGANRPKNIYAAGSITGVSITDGTATLSSGSLTAAVNIDLTGHAYLPLTNDAVTPTINFGDDGDGIYSSADGYVDIATNGVRRAYFSDTVFSADAAMRLLEQAAAATSVAGYGQIYVKTGTPNTLWFADDTAAEVQLGAGGGGTTFAVNVETLADAKTIADGDPQTQLLDPDGENRDVYLPAAPAADSEFWVVNSGSRTGAFYLEVSLSGDATEYFTRVNVGGGAHFVYDSTDSLWRCVGPGFINTRTGADTYDQEFINTSIGQGANASNFGSAFGGAANANDHGAAVGGSANARNHGAAVGYAANGSVFGVGVGNGANGSNFGVAVGDNADACPVGVALGDCSDTNTHPYSTALGPYSQGARYGDVASLGTPQTKTMTFRKSEVSWYGNVTAASGATEIFLRGVGSQYAVITSSSTVVVKGLAVARDPTANESNSWEFSCTIQNDAGTTAMKSAATITTIDEDDATWVFAIDAVDSTTDYLRMQFTPDADNGTEIVIYATLVEVIE